MAEGVFGVRRDEILEVRTDEQLAAFALGWIKAAAETDSFWEQKMRKAIELKDPEHKQEDYIEKSRKIVVERLGTDLIMAAQNVTRNQAKK